MALSKLSSTSLSEIVEHFVKALWTEWTTHNIILYDMKCQTPMVTFQSTKQRDQQSHTVSLGEGCNFSLVSINIGINRWSPPSWAMSLAYFGLCIFVLLYPFIFSRRWKGWLTAGFLNLTFLSYHWNIIFAYTMQIWNRSFLFQTIALRNHE